MIDRKMRGEPIDPAIKFVVGFMGTTTDDLTIFDSRITRFERCGRNGEPADAGASHATGSRVARHVTPRAICVLSATPIIGGEFPSVAADLDADVLSFRERQHGELRVAVIAARAGVGPCAFALALSDLMIF